MISKKFGGVGLIACGILGGLGVCLFLLEKSPLNRKIVSEYSRGRIVNLTRVKRWGWNAGEQDGLTVLYYKGTPALRGEAEYRNGEQVWRAEYSPTGRVIYQFARGEYLQEAPWLFGVTDKVFPDGTYLMTDHPTGRNLRVEWNEGAAVKVEEITSAPKPGVELYIPATDMGSQSGS